jgi:hypothetical protein
VKDSASRPSRPSTTDATPRCPSCRSTAAVTDNEAGCRHPWSAPSAASVNVARAQRTGTARRDGDEARRHVSVRPHRTTSLTTEGVGIYSCQ